MKERARTRETSSEVYYSVELSVKFLILSELGNCFLRNSTRVQLIDIIAIIVLCVEIFMDAKTNAKLCTQNF